MASVGRADAAPRVDLYSEPDLRGEAGALMLLLAARIDTTDLEVGGSVRRVGTKLQATLQIRGQRGVITAEAPYGAIDTLAATLAKQVVAVGGGETTPASASIGQLRPFARAAAALTRGDGAAAADALLIGRPVVAGRVFSARRVAERVAADPRHDLATRANLLLAGAAAAAALDLVSADPDQGDSEARWAVTARIQLARSDLEAAVAASKQLGRGRSPLATLARAELAHRRDETRPRDQALAALLRGSPFPPALAMVVELPPGALSKSTEARLLAVAYDRRGEWPGLTASLGLRAARGGVEVERALDLVEVAELDSAEVAALTPLVDRAVAAGWGVGWRLRAELRLRRNNIDGALADLEAGIAADPKDARLRRHLARILVEKGESVAAVAAWQAIAAPTAADRRELARAYQAADQGDRATAIYRTLADPTSVESEVAAAVALLEDDQAEAAAAKLALVAALSPDDPALQRQLAAAYAAAGKSEDAALANRRASELERNEPVAAPEAESATPTAITGAVADKPVADAAALALAAELPTLIERFPSLIGHAHRRVALAPLAGSHEPFYSRYQVVPDALAQGLTQVLGFAPYSLQVVADDDSFGRPLGQSKLRQLATRLGVDGVLLYGLRVKGNQAVVTLVLYEAESNQASEASLDLDGRSLGLVVWNPAFLRIVTLLGVILALWLLWRLLRGTGEVVVTIKRDPAAEEEAFALVVTRGGRAPTIGDAKTHAADLRRGGFHQGRFRVTMVGPTTRFDRIPSGRWHVHLVGTYVKGHELRILEGPLSKSVRVRRHKPSHVTFDLVPTTTEFRITVYDAGGPQGQAEVWIDGNRQQAKRTAADGTVTVEVPTGTHVLYIEVGGTQVGRRLEVHDTKIHTLSVSMERERRLAEAADGIELSPDESIEIERTNAAVDEPAKAATLAAGSAAALEAAARTAALGSANLAAAASVGVVSPGATQPDLTGLQRYRPDAELGRGAMGVVYRARDQVLERPVALKVMSEQLREQPVALKMFLQEAKALAALNHPNVVTVFDQGQDQGQAFMVMEFVEGTTLEDLLADRGHLSLDEGLAIGEQLCAGLGYAHKRRVIHRDIKPANIFVTSDGTVKLGDFGLARVLHELRIHQTEVRGTPLYMAPEQIQGTDIDFRVDIYAVGCTLFEVFTGRPPFVDGEVLYHHLHTEPPHPTEFLPDLPGLLDATIMACIAKDKNQRFRSVEALGAALAKVRAGPGRA